MKITITRIREDRIEDESVLEVRLEIETQPDEKLGDFVEVLLAQFVWDDEGQPETTASASPSIGRHYNTFTELTETDTVLVETEEKSG